MASKQPPVARPRRINAVARQLSAPLGVQDSRLVYEGRGQRQAQDSRIVFHENIESDGQRQANIPVQGSRIVFEQNVSEGQSQSCTQLGIQDSRVVYEQDLQGVGQGRIVQGQQQRAVVQVAQASPQIIPQFQQSSIQASPQIAPQFQQSSVPVTPPLQQVCPPTVKRVPVIQRNVQAVPHVPVHQAQTMDSLENSFLQQGNCTVNYEEVPNTQIVEYTTYPTEGNFIQPMQQSTPQVHYQETHADHPGTVQLIQQHPTNYHTQPLSSQGGLIYMVKYSHPIFIFEFINNIYLLSLVPRTTAHI